MTQPAYDTSLTTPCLLLSSLRKSDSVTAAARQSHLFPSPASIQLGTGINGLIGSSTSHRTCGRTCFQAGSSHLSEARVHRGWLQSLVLGKECLCHAGPGPKHPGHWHSRHRLVTPGWLPAAGPGWPNAWIRCSTHRAAIDQAFWCAVYLSVCVACAVCAGKTTTCQMVSEASGLQYINVGDWVKDQGLHSGFNEEHQAFIIDEDKVWWHIYLRVGQIV